MGNQSIARAEHGRFAKGNNASVGAGRPKGSLSALNAEFKKIVNDTAAKLGDMIAAAERKGLKAFTTTHTKPELWPCAPHVAA